MLSSATLVGEANGGSNKIDASVLDIADINTAAPVTCKVRTTAGEGTNNCGPCATTNATYQIKVIGGETTAGRVLCNGVVIAGPCTVPAGKHNIACTFNDLDPQKGNLGCRVTVNASPSKFESASCKIK